LLLFAVLQLLYTCHELVSPFKVVLGQLLRKPVKNHGLHFAFTLGQLGRHLVEFAKNLLVQWLHLILQILDHLSFPAFPCPLVYLILNGAHVVEAAGCQQVEELDECSVLLLVGDRYF
jgi:hypothetical protein